MKRFFAIAASFLLAACGPASQPVTLFSADAIPERLSDWGVVAASGNFLQLGDGVVPYELSTPLFTDYALKLRTVWIPEGQAAEYNATREFDFPVGTIISKTFHYERAADTDKAELRFIKAEREVELDGENRLDLGRHTVLETRLLVHYDDGWKAFPYVWNRDQTEAWLEIAGDVMPVELTGDDAAMKFAYVVPDANQCAGCHTPDHTAKALKPIGPRAWQLNREFEYASGSANQLDHWQALGLLSGVEVEPPQGAIWASRADYSIDEQARAYLDINCAHCHNASGAADTSGLHLDIDAPYDRNLGICKPPVAVGRGSGDRPYDIFPGRPDLSIMLYRMQHTDPAIAMPELGRSTAHAEGVAMMEEWIKSLEGDC